jgi:adenine/guanine/hypoxanthine permease
MNINEKLFKLKDNKTTVKTEILAGATTFMTMAYILIVNPNILSDAGMDIGAVFTATALVSALATFTMAFLTNYPIALAPGMGLNAFFAYTVVSGMGYSWQIALACVFIEGLIFIALTLFKFRETLVNCIPMNLKYGITVGIGIFIAFIGLQNAGIIVKDPDTILKMGDLKTAKTALACFGIIITACLYHFKIKGALLLGILAAYGMGIIFQVSGIYAVSPDAGMYSLIPDTIISPPPSLSPLLLKFDLAGAFTLGSDLLIILFAFLFMDLFDTVGTLIGVAGKAGLLDKDGNLPKAKKALMADAVGTTAGAALGTSTVTSYIESSAGIAEGGRTGLVSVTVGILFLAALVFSPVLTAIPGFATAPALIMVGLFMASSVTKIDLQNDYTEALPAFLAVIIMPLAYSIADGIMFGILSWFFLKIITGKANQLHPVIYFLSAFFILHIIF